MLFKNPVIDFGELPSVEEVAFQRLSPAYRAVSYISTMIFFVFLSLGWALFYLLATGVPEWITMGSLVVLLLLFVSSMALVNSRYRVAGYALRAHDILYRSGVFWRSTTIIPYVRIQHVEVSQGPVQSAFGIATLRIYTAGGTRSDLTIDGVEWKKATAIKEFITRKVGAVEAAQEVQDGTALRSEEEKLRSEEKSDAALRSEEEKLRSEEKSDAALRSEEEKLRSEEKSDAALRSEEEKLRSEEKEKRDGGGNDTPAAD